MRAKWRKIRADADDEMVRQVVEEVWDELRLGGVTPGGATVEERV